MGKRITKRAEQAAATKNRIYQVGVQLFKENDYEAVSVEQIAKAAGVGIGTFYHYYQSKAVLFNEVFINAEDYIGHFQKTDLEGQDPYDVLQNYFYQYVRLNASIGVEYMSSLTSSRNRKALGIDLKDTVTEIIRYYQQAGKLRDSDSAEHICDMLFIIARGALTNWAIQNCDYPLEKNTAQLIDLLLKNYLL